MTDARRGSDRFGEARLHDAVADSERPSAGALAAELESAVVGFSDGPIDDDLALLVLRVRDDQA
jgi:serine phosphatase RsbU (regulator of sigma subunit)